MRTILPWMRECRKPSKILGSIVALILFISAPSARGEDVQIKRGQAVRIATMDMPQFGLATRNAVDLAIEQFGGALLGHPIQTKHYGKGCDQRAELDGFIQGLIREPKTVGLIGPICSGRTVRIVQTLSDAQVLTISPANTFVGLTDPVFHDLIPYYFRTAPNDLFQGVVGARFALHHLGAATAAIIYYDEGSEGAYSTVLRNGFYDTFTAGNGTVCGEFPVPLFQEDFTAILDAIGQVDIIYAPLFLEDFGPLVQQLRERGSTPLIGSDGSFVDFLFEFSGSNPEELYVSSPGTAGPNHVTFVTAYLAKYGHEPGAFEPLAYDATQLLLRALAAVAQEDAKGNLSISPEDLLAYMNDPANYPFVGAGATHQAPVNGDFNPDGYSVFQAVGGEFIPIFP